VAIPPDTKDWTWVITSACPECGFDARRHPRGSTASVLRAVSKAWDTALARDSVRTRERPDRWSTLEYGCHVRDAHRVFGGRLDSMLREDDPTFPNWDQDETARLERYDQQDPTAVARELVTAANVLAARFDSVTEPQWSRRGTRSNGSVFTVETLGSYALHDVVHHLWDVGSPFEL
jgi:hypothetical protein